jgi:GNAT superfamily N-acetyltransferase
MLDRLHRLADGTTIELRDLRQADRAGMIDGFAHLSRESRYRRFLGAMNQLGERQLRALLGADGVDHIALVAIDVDARNRELRGIGIAHSFRDPRRPERAEYAIVVADEWQGRGVGRLLTRALAAEAFRHGVREWTATMLFDNAPVRRLLRSVGDETRFVTAGPGVVDGTYALRPSCFAGSLVTRRPSASHARRA